MANKQNNNLTPEQNSAILDRGKNLLVSASAGSGKTFVMIQRILDLIKTRETTVDDILVVTFTKAAASEMRERLVRGLEEIENKDNYVLEQLSNISTASISTLHSFCAKLLKTYFYVVGLDPSFILIDELESTALKNKALTKLIDSRFQLGDKAFFELLDIFSINRKEDNFREIILKLYHYLLTQTDENWFTKSVNNAYQKDLDKNVCAKFVNDFIVGEFRNLTIEADKVLESVTDQPKLVEVVNSIYINLLKIKQNNSFKENAHNLGLFEKVKSIPTKVAEGEEYKKELVKTFKAKYSKALELAEKHFLFDQSGETEKRLEITRLRVLAIFEYTKIFKEIYDNLKREKVALDFADLEEFTLKLLRNSQVADEIKEKYKYVFVDEYQDTNLIQEEILNKITRGNNLFMVGDVKQSIYKFRASEPEIFVNKYKVYSSGRDNLSKAIDLNHNFRSHQDILAFSNIVFNRNMTQEFGQVDYKGSAQLKKGDMFYPVVNNIPSVQVSVINCDSVKSSEIVGPLPVYSVKNHQYTDEENLKKAEAEGRVIVSHIKEFLGKDIYNAKTKQNKVIDYSDIAILTANRGSYLELVLKELDKAKIPYSSDIELGVFEDSYVSALRSFLEILSNPCQDMHCFAVMNSKMFDFSINDLAEIRLLNPDKKYFHEAVESSKTMESLSPKLKKKLKIFDEQINKFTFFSKFLQVDELIIEILNGTGFINRILSEPNGEKSVSLINKLLSFLNGKSYNSTLSKFLDYIKDNEIKFGMDGVENGVKVTTIHKSKGLEYPVVILMGAGQNILKRNRGEFILSKNFGVGIDYYDNTLRTKQKTLVKNAITLETDRAEREERLRLLYVALTRAVNHLVVVGCKKNEVKDLPQNAENFFDWILPAVYNTINNGEECRVVVKEKSIKDLETRETLREEKEVPILVDSKSIQNTEIKRVLKYKYPYESLVSVPTKTSVSEILKSDEKDYFVPSVVAGEETKDAIQKGLGYHKLLSLINLKSNTKEKLDYEIKNLVTAGKISVGELNYVNLNDILELLNNKQFKEIINSRLIMEQEFIALSEYKKNTGENVIVQGVVDLIAITDDGIIVIDYKTNNSTNPQFYVNTYKKQLDIYADVASKSYNKKIIKKLIYSFKLKKFIEV